MLTGYIFDVQMEGYADVQIGEFKMG